VACTFNGMGPHPEQSFFVADTSSMLHLSRECLEDLGCFLLLKYAVETLHCMHCAGPKNPSESDSLLIQPNRSSDDKLKGTRGNAAAQKRYRARQKEKVNELRGTLHLLSEKVAKLADVKAKHSELQVCIGLEFEFEFEFYDEIYHFSVCCHLAHS
jgi:hypothetical protein